MRLRSVMSKDHAIHPGRALAVDVPVGRALLEDPFGLAVGGLQAVLDLIGPPLMVSLYDLVPYVLAVGRRHQALQGSAGLAEEIAGRVARKAFGAVADEEHGAVVIQG